MSIFDFLQHCATVAQLASVVKYGAVKYEIADRFTLGKKNTVFFFLPGGMDSVADGDNVARPTHIQVRSREGDEAGVSHSMLVPTQHNTQAKVDHFISSWLPK